MGIRIDNFCWQTPILMKLVSVDRALKELQNDILFVRLYLISYIVVDKRSSTDTGTLRLREVNFTRYGACTKQLAGKKGIIL